MRKEIASLAIGSAVALSLAASPALGQAKLISSAADGDAADVKSALAAGAKVDAPDEEGITALTYAIVKNTFHGKEVVGALLKAKASPNAKSKDGRTPLMFAAQYCKREHYPALLAAGAQVNAKDADGWTPLMYAAFNCTSFDVKDLLKAGADPKVKDTQGRTPLLMAVQHGSEMNAQALMEAGARFSDSVPKGTTPLILAAVGDDLSSLELVLKTKPDVNAKDDEGWTALMIAAESANTDNVAALLRAGADAKPRDKAGLTALDHAVKGQCDECAALLGAPWEKRKPSGGTTISVPCEPLGGALDLNLALEGNDLVFAAFYPKPIGTYLGGFSESSKKVAASVHIYLDTDRDAKTGLKPMPSLAGDLGMGGAEYAVEFSEMGTTVRHPVTGKGVNRQVLDPTISKGDESLTSDQMSGFYPQLARDMNAARLKVPLSVFGLKPGAKVRVTVRPGFCTPKSALVALK